MKLDELLNDCWSTYDGHNLIYVYALYDPRNTDRFENYMYIGKAIKPKERLRAHIYESTIRTYSGPYGETTTIYPKSKKDWWINELLSIGLKPTCKIICPTIKDHVDYIENTLIFKLKNINKQCVNGFINMKFVLD